MLPYQFVRDHFFLRRQAQPPYTQHAPVFADVVIRCVRFAFANIPASIGGVFFSKPVALPFARFRMLRHGYLRSPLRYKEITLPSTDKHSAPAKGIWVSSPSSDSGDHDVVVYYVHGGGFSMGSAYFYLEFLMAWVTLLKERRGWRNPAVFALEYDLVPRETYPVQLGQTIAGYQEALRRVQGREASRVCVAGDSAGGTLALSLLLKLAQEGTAADAGVKPGFATLISPWCRLVSELHSDTRSDYLNADSLHLYAREYAGQVVTMKGMSAAQGGEVVDVDDPVASPGSCEDLEWWKRAGPRFGYHFCYGSEEVFAPEIRKLAAKLRKTGAKMIATEEPANIHAWPVVALFLGESTDDRLSGLARIVDTMSDAMAKS